MNPNEFTPGRFVTEVVSGPAVETDCSAWNTMGEEITYGSFVTDVVSGPVVETDCTPWIEPIPPDLLADDPPAATEGSRLQMTFAIDPDLGLTPKGVMAKLVPILELVKGCGFAWDRPYSASEPGRITIQFMPTCAAAVARLPWLKETLTPVLADIREVTKPEWSDVPASKV